MAQVVSETQADLPPVQKYMQAMAVCNSLALLASQSAMLVFVQRLSVLKKLQTCWTKGSEAQILLPDDFEPDLEGEVVGVDSANDEVDVKLEPDFARTVDQRLPLLENGESSDDTIVDEPLACSVVLCDDIDAVKAEMEVVEEEKPPVKKTSLKIGQRTKVKVQENEDVKAMPKRKRGRPVKPKKATETKEPAEKRSRCEAKEEAVEDPKSSTFRFLCIICKEAFATFVQLKEHKSEAHGPDTLDISSSVESLQNPNHSLADRTIMQNKRNESATVSIANKVLRDVCALKMRSSLGATPYMCTICSLQFTEGLLLKKHVLTHFPEKRYTCAECGVQFAQSYDLTVHARAHHTGERPFACDWCDKRFVKSTHLKYHSRLHTGERPYLCPICGASFARPTGLRDHQQSHSMEKTFSCDFCEMSFRQQNALCRHRKTHLSVKPFQCNVCNKTFITAYNLKTHMRTHTGEKPYACDGCQRAFAYQVTLNKHRLLCKV